MSTPLGLFEFDLILFVHRKYGLSYANPHVQSEWKHRFIPMQVASREKCRTLLYVITGRTRSLSSMIEVRQNTCISISYLKLKICNPRC